MILYGSNYKLVKYIDSKEGRCIIAAVKSQETSFILANAYFPNDHVQGKIFAEKLYDNIWEMQNELTEFLTILGGDFNTCISDNETELAMN
jgi:exonuclease III